MKTFCKNVRNFLNDLTQGEHYSVFWHAAVKKDRSYVEADFEIQGPNMEQVHFCEYGDLKDIESYLKSMRALSAQVDAHIIAVSKAKATLEENIKEKK